MKSETEWTLERIKLYQLKKEHPDWSLAAYARELGHDPGWVRKWLHRIEAAKPLRIETFKSLSRARKTPPRQTTKEAKELVAELRQTLSEKYHRNAGARTILYGLKQRQTQQPLTFEVPKAASTINKILHEMGYIQPPKPRFHEPINLPEPMTEWEMDFGEVFLEEAGVFEFLIVIDRGTSRLVYLEGGQGYNAETALEAVARLLVLHGLPQRLRFDRDPRLWGSWTRDSYPSPLIRFLRALGIEPVICPPRRPDLKPFVERSVKTLKFEWLARLAPVNLAEAWDALELFPHYYNDERPHQGQACQNQPPSVAFPSLPKLADVPETVDPDRWLDAYHKRIYRRRVNSDGTIQIDRHTYSIGSQYAKQPVLVHLDAKHKVFLVSLEGQFIRQLALRGLYDRPMKFQEYLKAMTEEARTIDYHRHLLWEKTGEIA